MNNLRRSITVIFILLGASGGVEAQVRSVKLLTPRLFGYFVGDVLHCEVDVRVDRNVVLNLASVPQPGPLNAWLELAGSRVETEAEGDARLYRIYLGYQIFYPALDVRQLAIPGFALSFESSGHNYTTSVPTWSFSISPLREVLPRPKASGGAYMQPDAPPSYYQIGHLVMAGIYFFVAALLTLVLLAFHQAWWPFAVRGGRPFTEAARTIRKLLGHGAPSAAHPKALIALHRALDATAGHVVLYENLPDFLLQHQSFQSLRDEFMQFFVSSRMAFYGEDRAAAAAAFNLNALRRFSERLAVAERSAR